MSPLTIDERRVPAGKITLNLTETGAADGPALVWLHGAGPGASGLSNFRRNLPEFSAFRNLVFDLPRFGKSDKPVLRLDRGEFFAPYAANAVSAALAEMGVDRYSLIGNSMGGATAIKIAADYPSRVESVVLMAAAGTTPPDWNGGIPVGLQKIGEWLQNGPSERLVREFAELQVYDASALTEELLAERLAAASDPEITNTNREHNMLPGDLNQDMPKIEARTLLLWGREDNFIPLEWGLNAVRRIPDATLQVIPHTGHWVQFERAELFNSIVSRFLLGTSI